MKWASREAVDVYFKAKSLFQLGARTIRAGEPVLIFDSVKTSTLEVGAEISYVTGGRGNNRLLSFEGDKSLTFQFEDALLSNEGLAILAGADLIPARNKHLDGAAAVARSVISHYTEKYSVITANVVDTDASNNYLPDATLGAKAKGGELNVFLTKKPYVGQNGSIYIMLLDDAGEMSGAPIQINLDNIGFTAAECAARTAMDPATAPTAADIKGYHAASDTLYDSVADGAGFKWSKVGVGPHHSYLGKFQSGDSFVAFGGDKLPIAVADYPDPASIAQNGAFDDMVEWYAYVPGGTEPAWWQTAWGAFAGFVRNITATGYGTQWGDITPGNYSYLLAPTGGIAQPRAYKEGANFVYKVNVPSIFYQDIVLCDYYVEYQHDATQISILPDKFGPFMYVEGSTLVRRASDGIDLPAEFVIPKFKITTALTFTMQGTGDPSTFAFQGDAYPDFSKFDLSRKVLADIQILDADDNYDGASGTTNADPTSYRRYKYNNDSDGEYIWKDPSMEPHQNLDYSDILLDATTKKSNPNYGGPATRTPGNGVIDTPSL